MSYKYFIVGQKNLSEAAFFLYSYSVEQKDPNFTLYKTRNFSSESPNYIHIDKEQLFPGRTKTDI